MGHCQVVAFQRRSVSSRGSVMTLRAAQVHVQRAARHVDARPDDFAGLGNAAQRAAAFREIHRRLAETFRACPAVDEMRRRRAAADLEHPDVILRRAGLIPIAPAQIVQRVFRRLLERLVNALGEQAVESGALVHFVEVRERLAVEEHALAVARFHRRTIGVVQRAFHEIAGGQQVLQSLLVLNADAVAAEVIGDAHGGDVHLALPENLRVGQIGGVVRAGVELHAALFRTTS